MIGSEVSLITIDGPSGSGKGTVARRVAEQLGWHLLDSGALYRLVALAGERRGIDPQDEAGFARIAQDLDVKFGADLHGEEQIWLEGERSVAPFAPSRQVRGRRR